MKVSREAPTMRRDEERAAMFPLGKLVVTPAAQEWLTPAEIERALARHAQGDWGDLDPEDWPLSDQAVVTRQPVVSVHTTADGIRFWIITEERRQTTIVMLPGRYERACAGRGGRYA